MVRFLSSDQTKNKKGQDWHVKTKDFRERKITAEDAAVERPTRDAPTEPELFQTAFNSWIVDLSAVIL